MGQIIYSPEALDNVRSIANRIAEHNPSAAIRTIDEFDRVLQLLVDFPKAAEAVDQLLPNMRRTTSGSYVIYYRQRGEDIDVVRVVHGVRDIGKIFG